MSEDASNTTIVSHEPKHAVGSWLFRQRFRFYILAITTACLTSVFANMITVNTTLNCMDPTNKSASVYDHPVHTYTSSEKTVLQWTVSIASMIATFPFSWMCTTYGARYVFFASGMASAVSTAIIPQATDLGFGWFIFARVFQGLAYACDFAVMGVLCSRWASLTENAKFLALMTCFSPIANAVAQFFSGLICDSSLGWPWVHYLHGAVGAVLFMLWFYLYSDDPRYNRFVSQHELSVIHHEKSEAHKNLTRYVPYKEIAKDKVVWAVWISAFADLYSGFFLFIYAPTYTIKVSRYAVGSIICFRGVGAEVLDDAQRSSGRNRFTVAYSGKTGMWIRQRHVQMHAGASENVDLQFGGLAYAGRHLRLVVLRRFRDDNSDSLRRGSCRVGFQLRRLLQVRVTHFEAVRRVRHRVHAVHQVRSVLRSACASAHLRPGRISGRPVARHFLHHGRNACRCQCVLLHRRHRQAERVHENCRTIPKGEGSIRGSAIVRYST